MSFQTAPGSGPALMALTPLGERTLDSSQAFSFSLPPGTFTHTDPSARVTVEVQQANGQPLPGWIRFDPQTGTLRGEPPPGFEGTINVNVIARDNNGRVANNPLRLRIGDEGQRGFERERPEAPEMPQRQSQLHELPLHAEIAVDAKGSETEVAPAKAGKASLNEQFASYGRPAWENDRSALVRSAEAAARMRNS